MSLPLPPPTLYSPTTSTHHLPSLARLHETCITTDNLMATFLPPLSHDKILASWQAWSDEVAAGQRIIVLQLAPRSSSPSDSIDSADSVVAGVVSLHMPDTETGKHRSEVGRLLVSPDFRKRGIARRLMGVLEGEARRAGRWMVTLDTTIGSGAEYVYPKLGYKEIGVVPNFGFSPRDGTLLDEMFFYKDLRQSDSGDAE